jgi:hypothetical protein
MQTWPQHKTPTTVPGFLRHLAMDFEIVATLELLTRGGGGGTLIFKNAGYDFSAGAALIAPSKQSLSSFR